MIGRLLFRSRFFAKTAKIPTIQEVKQDWNEFSSKYNTFDLGPQTFFFSLANILHLQSASNILEVACGTGKLLPYAIEKKGKDAHYLASDLSPNMIAIAKENLKSHFERYQSQLSFQEWCRVQKLQLQVINAQQHFQHELFDRIICNCALMLTSNPLKMLQNLSNLAKPGCLFGLSVWGKRELNNMHMAILESIVENDFPLPGERSKFHLYQQVGALAEQTGWEVVLNWEQNTLFPVLEYSPENNTELFHYQVDKLPEYMRPKVKSSLEKKLAKIFQEKKGANFACELYVLRKK